MNKQLAKHLEKIARRHAGDAPYPTSLCVEFDVVDNHPRIWATDAYGIARIDVYKDFDNVQPLADIAGGKVDVLNTHFENVDKGITESISGFSGVDPILLEQFVRIFKLAGVPIAEIELLNPYCRIYGRNSQYQISVLILGLREVAR